MRHAEWMEADERIDTAKERIERAAIRHDGRIFSVPAPGRHHHVIKLIIDTTAAKRVPADSTQGFVTNTGRFLDREEACVVAIRADQLIRKTYPENLLFSEDLW